MNGSTGQRAETHRDDLIESYLPLVRSIAGRYAGRGESVEDLVQVGAIGLIRSSERFDPARGVAFASFATPAIEGEIRRHLGDQTTALRIPRDVQRQVRRLVGARTRLSASLGRSPNVEELAEALGAEVEEVECALEAERACEPAPAPADETEVEESVPSAASEDRLLLARGARVLDQRERRIVLLRFHRDMTERQIAAELGISQAHVSRLLARALAKLRQAMTRDDAVSPPRQLPNPEDPPDQPPAARRKTASGASGRFLVRMPGPLHEQLSEAAERQHVSLNRFITETLTASLGQANRTDAPREDAVPQTPPEDAAQQRPPERASRFRMLVAANLVVIVLTVVAAVVLLVLALERGI